jgi:lysophospholipid acyltransferase (LPLAT)-like uncharacterized protein
MIRLAAEGRSVAILCDGPRGPARACKPGVVAAARAVGLPLQPVGIAARPALVFRSWDRTLLPLPFARVGFVMGPQLRVPPELDRDGLERWRARVEQEIERAQERAVALAA